MLCITAMKLHGIDEIFMKQFPWAIAQTIPGPRTQFNESLLDDMDRTNGFPRR